MTEQAEQTTLLAQPDGAATLRANQARAEELYLAVAQNHPDQADAYRELGFLYERQARYSDAAAEYRRYLDLVASTSLDYLRIQRRLAAIEKLAAPQPH
jgi:tetratricopeptide (TPR) repeat protein